VHATGFQCFGMFRSTAAPSEIICYSTTKTQTEKISSVSRWPVAERSGVHATTRQECSMLRDTLAPAGENENVFGFFRARQVEIFLFGSFCVEHLRDGWGRALWQHCVAARCATRLRWVARSRTTWAGPTLDK
jgi:hypothetical protein